MTKMLDTAVAKLRQLSPEEQDRVAQFLLHLADTAAGDDYRFTLGERAAIKEALAQIDRGELASEEEVAALWKKCGH